MSDSDDGGTCAGGKEGGGGDKVRAHPGLSTQPHTVEPWFNEVPRDWGNLLVISRVPHIEILNFTHFWQNKQNVHHIDVHVWTISVINNNNKFVYKAMVSVKSCT